MEKIEEKGQTPDKSASDLEAEERFENEGGAESEAKSLRLPPETATESHNLWCQTVSNFQRLKNYSSPVLTELWKGSRLEYLALKKSLGAARIAYKKEKKKGGNSK